jgi:hypothetical protein
MAAPYEIDIKKFDYQPIAKLPLPDLIALGEKRIARCNASGYVDATTKDMVGQYKKRGSLSESQINYLARLVYPESDLYIQYEKDFVAWYDSRTDIQEIYKYGITHGYQYIRLPNNTWTHRGADSWDASWDERPRDSEMFWRVMNDWNVKKFKEIKRESAFEEGDLIVLRTPHVANWRYDPYYDGSHTPDKLVERIGTVMQMTDDVHRRSRAGKGSRLVNVLWVGATEIKGVPERIIKLHERKKRAK